MSLGTYSFSFPIWVEFGNGASERVGPLLESQGHDSTLIITDPGIIDAGLIDGIVASLETHDVTHEVFDGVEPNPTVSMVDAATEELVEGGFDAAVGLGGGSALDVAKSAALMATNPGKLPDYEVNTPEDVVAGKMERHTHPLVTIPTTAGTGSEVDYWTVITDETRKFKMALGQAPLTPGGPYLGADIALVDPDLTRSLPPRITAATGFDAFSHGLENYVARGSPPLVKAYTRQVMGLVPEHLPAAYDEGDPAAREYMMFASHIAGFCENFAGFGAIHSLAEVTGGMYPEIPHGEAIAVYTPPVMRYNLEAYPGRYAEVAHAMGLDIDGYTEREAALAAVDAVEALIDRVDLPTTLRSFGVAEEDLATIAETSLNTIEIHDNPRDADAADLLEIAKAAY